MIVSIISPKGGCGKSTLTLVLASVFAENKTVRVAVLDADPRQSIARIWSGKRKGGSYAEPPFSVYSETSESEVQDLLEKLESEFDLVFVDLEGVAGLMATYAASSSDICLVPMRPSALDGDAAGSALKMIGNAAKASRREIPSFLILTQTDAAIRTQSYREVRAEINASEGLAFQTELMRRASFERIVALGCVLDELPKSEAVTKAIANAQAIARELDKKIEELE